MPKPQAIKYQRTDVESTTSVNEIEGLVRKYGGVEFTKSWSRAGHATGVRFKIPHPVLGEIPIALTAPTERIVEILYADGMWQNQSPFKRRELIEAQAERIAWRHLRDWCEQQLLAVSLGVRTLHGTFMGDIETWDAESGEKTTLGALVERRAVVASGALLLPGRGPLQLPPPSKE